MRAIKVRIYPNKSQIETINKSFGCSRFVYNQALALKINRYHEFGETVSSFEIMKMITFWKSTEEREWLKEAHSQALQQSLRHLDSAYKKFFKDKKGFPKFKKKSGQQSFSVVGNVSIVDNMIRFPKLGVLRCKGLRKFAGAIKTATLSRNPAGQYFLSWCVDDVEKLTKPKELHKGIGIDAGVKTMLSFDSGEKKHFAHPLKSLEKKLKYYQIKKSKCHKGSRSFKKWKLKIARIWNKINNIKKDFLHKTTTEIVKNHDYICVEKLQIKNMLKNHKLAKSIQEMSWGELYRQLEYKADWYGKYFVAVPPQRTTQECSECGYINKELTLQDREWVCPQCRTEHDRDTNAAKNIKKKGMDSILKSCGVTFVGEHVETRTPCL